MREWLSSLASARIPEIVIAIALGTALAGLAASVAGIAVDVLVEHAAHIPSDASDDTRGLLEAFPSVDLLNFEVAGTVVVYGYVLHTSLALGLVLLAALFVVRRRNRELGECPFCASRIPYDSTHCAYCGSGIAPAES